MTCEYSKFDVMADTDGVSVSANEKRHEEINESALKAKIDELRKKLDSEMVRDMMAIHGANMEDELRAQALYEMSKS